MSNVPTIYARFGVCSRCGRLLLHNGREVRCLCRRDMGTLTRAERLSVIAARAAELHPLAPTRAPANVPLVRPG